MSSGDSSSSSDYEDIDTSDSDSEEEHVGRGFLLMNKLNLSFD